MQVHLFKGAGRIFAVTEDAKGGNLPARLAPWEPFKAIDLVQGVLTPGLNVDECLADLAKYGLHITDAHVRITENYV